MSNLDTIARRHAEVVRLSVSGDEPPTLTAGTSVAATPRVVLVAVVAAAVGVTALIPFAFTGPTSQSQSASLAALSTEPGGSAFMPPSSRQGNALVFPMVLLDGTRLLLTLPDALAGDVHGFVPGGAVGWSNGVCCGRTLDVIHGSVAQIFGDRDPDAVYSDAANRPVNFYADPDGLDYLVFQFGSWVVQAWDDGPVGGEQFSEEDRTKFASLLDGEETPEGFLILKPTTPMSVMPADSPDATLITSGGDPLVGIVTGRTCAEDALATTSHGYTVTHSTESGITELCSPTDSTAILVHRTDLAVSALNAISLERNQRPHRP